MMNKNIAVIGLGYVGLPLAVELSKKYPTIGFDNNNKRIAELKKGQDLTLEVAAEELKRTELYFTSEEKKLIECNIYIITVPTPVDKYNNPDMRPLESATKIISKVLNKKDIVIYESTVYPGATEDFCVPILEEGSGLKFNTDFFCGYSPERINPGDTKHTLKKIVKVTSGSNKKTANNVDDLYKSIIEAGTYKASSIKVAEAAKVIENIQRDVNIALINELSLIFNKLNLDTLDILEAAGTKWNFLPFRPGLVGGHCIGVDPHYLTYKAIEIGYNPEMILAGRRINDSMGEFFADKTISEMAKAGINPVNSNIAIFGLTFKENCPDLRNTKVINIIKKLKDYNCNLFVIDQFADEEEANNLYNIKLDKFDKLRDIDAVIITVAHDYYKNIKVEVLEKIMKNNSLLIDIKSLYPKNYFDKSNINHWRL
jgi:UDP-N-acetyl-D-glucosamine/UDP-N-acetyl-D-galactosamine dehydrogenase